MFKNAFSFNGRIRRTEYGISFIIYLVCYLVISLLAYSQTVAGLVGALVLLIPTIWFIWAQGAKRCHDRGNSGFFQLIPFYFFWMLFAEGEKGPNNFGEDPKAITTATA